MKKYLITLTPKHQERIGCNFYIAVVAALNKTEALKMIPSVWPVGDRGYKKLELSEIKGDIFTETI